MNSNTVMKENGKSAMEKIEIMNNRFLLKNNDHKQFLLPPLPTMTSLIKHVLQRVFKECFL